MFKSRDDSLKLRHHHPYRFCLRSFEVEHRAGMAMTKNSLLNTLTNYFPENDAVLLAELLNSHLDKETIRYKEVDIVESQKKDLMLLAFEERILIPIKSRSGPAWEDRILDFRDEGRYFIPPVVKAMVTSIYDIGKPSCNAAVRQTLGNVIQKDISGFVELLQTTMKHANNYFFETGLLEIFFNASQVRCDLHDIIDMFVIYGMMSPCPRKSLMTGLSWYEINPTLYWDKAFLI